MIKTIENKIKYLTLKLLRLWKTSSKRRSHFEFDEDSKILIIRLNLIGDALITSPLIKLLKENSGCRIDVLASERNKYAFSGNPYVDNIIVYDKGFFGLLKLINSINKEEYDFIVDAHDDTSTTVSLLLSLCDSTYKYGLTKANSNLYTKTIERLDSTKHHIIERILEIIKLFRIKPEYEKTNIIYTPAEESKQKAIEFIKYNFPAKKFLAGINIQAGSGARFWGKENYIKLIEFLKNYEINILIFSSNDNYDIAKEIGGINPVYNCSFDELAAMISELDLLITPDTSAVHLASAYHTPVFGFYVHYNTNDIIWYPYKSEFDYMLTTEPNLNSITFEETKTKLDTFIKKLLVNMHKDIKHS